MAIAGKPAARAMKSKGVKAKNMSDSSASRKTKTAFTKLSNAKGKKK